MVFGWRDVVSIIGIVYLLWLIKSDLRDLNTNFLAYQKQQSEQMATIRGEVDAIRRRAEMGVTLATEAANKLEHLQGYLEGAGINGKGSKK